MRNYFLILIFIFFNIIVFSQNNIGVLRKSITFIDDTLKLDSLSLVPNTVFLFSGAGDKISPDKYYINYSKSLIINKGLPLNTEFIVSYRTFSINFDKKYFNKPLSLINDDAIKKSSKKNKYYDFYNSDYYRFNNKSNLDKRGSISRGVSFGNNQDVIVNSNLNLQLSGKLTDDLSVLASISDKNIPIQPDGNSQQIQDFDKVFISVFNDKTNIKVGDVNLNYNKSNFLKINKKLKGIIASNVFDISKNKSDKKIILKSTISGAVTKGKYARKTFYGVEGNQGPYKLSGAEGETNIVIIAGSEKVFIDGKLITRGLENDYTMNYNTGEISFTPNQIITKDKRISVEFEYTQQAYARFLLFNNNELKTKNGNYWINLYSENDSKSQSIQQTLTQSDKKMFAQIGDSLNMAYRLNIDSIGYTNDYVMYKKTDTIVNGKVKEIYVYSTNKDSAFYRLGFSNVGKGNGNYILINSTANGRVFKWIAPVNNLKQGEYEPIVLLVAPKKKQVLNIGAENKITKNLKSKIEFVVTNNDKNTFSTLDRADNTGYALKTKLINKFPLKNKNLELFTGIDYQLIDKNFDAVERFRSVEFNRDWNLSGLNLDNNEQLLTGNVILNINKSGFAKYSYQYMNKGNLFFADKNNLNIDLSKSGFNFKTLGSYLTSYYNKNNTSFFRDKSEFSKNIYSFKVGTRYEIEHNSWNIADSLLLNSYYFNQYEFFILPVDSAKFKLFANYKNRTDFLPKNNVLSKNSNAQDLLLGYNLASNKTLNLKTIVNYRNLSLIDTLLSTINPEDNLNGRLEYGLHILKNTVSVSSFYEIGSGLEVKKEFSYIEVNQGQGVYSWTDYNGNNVKELNEFEVAAFQDQANYIRVFIPTNNYIKTHYNQFNQVININPFRVWRKKKGIKKFISHFSNVFAYNVDNKISENTFYSVLNPFTSDINDTNLMSFNNSVRNIFTFNKTSQYFSIDYILQRNTNKLLMINGFDSRDNFLHGLNVRWNILRKFTLLSKSTIGNKLFKSEFFSSKNYNIKYFSVDNKFSFQPNTVYRISLLNNYTKKNNETSEQLELNKFGIELRYSKVKKGNMSLTFNYIKIDYPYKTNNSLAFEMLQGLMPGNNLTWEIIYQRSLSKTLMLNINYNGRYSNDNKIIHTGGIQLRAYF